MSAGFRYSHRDILASDIRHIYSGGLVSTNYRLGPPVSHEGINHLDRMHEAMTRRRTSKMPEKSFEYNSEYHTVLPCAPAFRRLSKSEVEDVVHRLTIPRDPKDQNDKNDHEAKHKTRVASAPADGARSENRVTPSPTTMQTKQLSKKDIDGMVNRLFRSKTHITEIRQREKVVIIPKATIPTPKKEKKGIPHKKETVQRLTN